MYRILFILSITLFTTPLFADEAADKAEFKRLYANFNDLYANSDDIEQIIEVGEKLYIIAPKVYGKNSQNTAVVTYNLAKIYDEKGKKRNNIDERKAIKLYGEYFDIIDKTNITPDDNYLDQYVAYVEAKLHVDRTNTKIDTINKLQTLLTNHPFKPIKKAETLHKMGLLYYRARATKRALASIDEAVRIFEQEKGQYYLEIADALFWKAKTELFHKDKYEARENFLKVLDIYEKNDLLGHKNTLSAHKYMVQLYQEVRRIGRSDKHCVAIAMQRNNEFDIFEDPIYREPAKLPGNRERAIATQKIAYTETVLVEFTIDKKGKTKHIEVIESTDKKFNKNTIQAIKKYRYAPQVIDGKIHETDGVRYLITYDVLK